MKDLCIMKFNWREEGEIIHLNALSDHSIWSEVSVVRTSNDTISLLQNYPEIDLKAFPIKVSTNAEYLTFSPLSRNNWKGSSWRLECVFRYVRYVKTYVSKYWVEMLCFLLGPKKLKYNSVKVVISCLLLFYTLPSTLIFLSQQKSQGEKVRLCRISGM